MPWTFSLEFLPCWWCKTLTTSFLHEGFPLRLPGVLLFTLLIFPLPDDFQGKVVSIADGDTVTVLRGREQVKVRLNGIDAPEKTRVSRPNQKALSHINWQNTASEQRPELKTRNQQPKNGKNMQNKKKKVFLCPVFFATNDSHHGMKKTAFLIFSFFFGHIFSITADFTPR
jgi:endonuclease YncB( thermonuclease family)